VAATLEGQREGVGRNMEKANLDYFQQLPSKRFEWNPVRHHLSTERKCWLCCVLKTEHESQSQSVCSGGTLFRPESESLHGGTWSMKSADSD
jgi:hypothetical protein